MLTELITNDCDQLSECLDATEQQYRQLDAGLFQGRFRRVDLPGVHLTEEFMSRRITVRAAIPESCVTLFMPLQQHGRITLEGHDCFRDEVYIGQPGTDAHLCLPSNFRSISIELEFDAVHAMAEAMHVSLPLLSPQSRLTRSRGTVTFRTLVVKAFATISRNASAVNYLSAQKWSDRILAAYVDVLHHAYGQPESVDRSTLLQRRSAALNAADYVTTHLAEPISLAKMCAVAEASERSLRSGFKDVFGVSPNRFIKVQRLSATRHELKRANPIVESVSTIASRWGFAQFAHFATDYHAQFGERPSETLRRAF